MTHDERLRLIMAPFPVVHIVQTSYPWSGALIGEKVYGKRRGPTGADDGASLCDSYERNEEILDDND